MAKKAKKLISILMVVALLAISLPFAVSAEAANTFRFDILNKNGVADDGEPLLKGDELEVALVLDHATTAITGWYLNFVIDTEDFDVEIIPASNYDNDIFTAASDGNAFVVFAVAEALSAAQSGEQIATLKLKVKDTAGYGATGILVNDNVAGLANHISDADTNSIYDVDLLPLELTISTDKSELAALIADAKTKGPEENYVEETWTALEDALTAAEAVYADDDATDAAIEDAARDLDMAIKGLTLKAADYSALQAAYDQALTYAEAEYTPSTYAVLKTAIEEAAAELETQDRPITEQSVLDTLAEALENAIEGLKLRPDTKAFDELAALMQAIYDGNNANGVYTAESYDEFKTLYEGKTDYTFDAESTQEAVDAAYNEYLVIFNQLISELDMAELLKALDKAEGYDAADYPSDLYETFANAKAEAERVRQSAQDQDEVDKAAEDLNDAMDALNAFVATITIESDYDSLLGGTALGGMAFNQKVSNLLKTFTVKNGSDFASLRVVDANGTPVPDTYVAKTGYVVELVHAGVVLESYTIVIYGDVNCDGQVTIADYLLAMEMQSDETGFTAAQIAAAKFGGDTIDLEAIWNLALGA